MSSSQLAVCFTLGLLGALLVAPMAAAGTGSATAQPSIAAPGETIALVYTIESDALAEVRASEDVACVIEGAERVPCGSLGELLDVRVQGSARSYFFEIQAPTTPGVYTASFARQALVGVALPPDAGEEAAQVAFTIQEGGAGGESELTPGTTGDTGGPDALLPAQGAVSPDGGARWLTSLFMGTGATAAAVVLARRGPGAP